MDDLVKDMIAAGRNADTAGQRAWPNWKVADALEAAQARIAELEGRVNRTLQDHGRMLWRDDIEPHCPDFELCSEYADNGLRCSPCAIKQSEAAGVEVLNLGKPYSPEECRINREIATLRGELAAAREALSKADAALEILKPTCISQFKNKRAAQTLIAAALKVQP